MYQALIAACCALAGLQPPLAQNWSDTNLIRADDDWSGVPAIVGYRGDGLVAVPGTDPRDVVADGSATPVDVAANRTDPGAIGLAAGVAEFELPNPVVALRGSETARAPQLVISLDTRNRAGIAIRLTLRDIDTSADAVQPIAVQYRVGGTGDFANVPGGYVADATDASPPDPDGTDSVNAAADELVTPVHVVLPPAADNRQLVEVRVLTADAPGRDEWVGVDDIAVTASTVTGPRDCGDLAPRPWPPPKSGPQRPPSRRRPELTRLTLVPETFVAARRGPAIARWGRAGAVIRFRLSESATVHFRVGPTGERLRPGAGPGGERLRLRPGAGPGGERLRFHARGRRGVNQMRFSGRIRGRRLSPASYTLTAVATGRTGLESAAATTRFRIENPQD